MANSILIAKLMGPVVLVAAIAMLANTKELQELARGFLEDRALIYITGVLAMLGGLAIVNYHNVWVVNWPVIITIFGWGMVIDGALRMAQPSVVRSIGRPMLQNAMVIRVSGAVWALIGALLTYQGYF